jgi:Fic family protein
MRKLLVYPFVCRLFTKGTPVLGRLVPTVWLHDPTIPAPARYRRSCQYDAFVPDPISDLSLDVPGEVVGLVSDAENSIRNLNSSAGSSLAPLARLLLRTESIASSKVEGMHVDARSLARAESNTDSGRSASATASEVLANIDAMQLAVEEAISASLLDLPQIAAIHRVLLRNSSTPEIAGEIRDVQNWIGGNDYNPCGASFVPPPPEEVMALLNDICDFCNQDRFPPIMQAAIAHAQFETIHPFIDGNGRTGRALIQVILRRRKLAPAFVPPISVVLAANKPNYLRGLTIYREGDIAGWIESFSVAAARSAELAQGYLRKVEALREDWREQLTASVRPRVDAAAWSVIDILPGHPVISIAIAAAATGRTRPAISQAIDQLVAAQVLVPISEGRRNRSWEAVRLLDLLVEIDSVSGT